MTTKLYTAAEARRIDIERGGKGMIRFPKTSAESYVQTTDDANVFESHEVKPILVYPSDAYFVPFTPEPEQEEAKYYAGFSWTKIRELEMECSRLQKAWEDENDKKVQLEEELADAKNTITDKTAFILSLEKELAEAKEREGIQAGSIRYHISKIEQLEKELAEYKDNYHEILADHRELTRKFDELKEKQRRKCCLGEPPFTGQPVRFLDGKTLLFKGYYNTETRSWFMKHGDHYIELTDRQVEDFYWKYEADL